MIQYNDYTRCGVFLTVSVCSKTTVAVGGKNIWDSTISWCCMSLKAETIHTLMLSENCPGSREVTLVVLDGLGACKGNLGRHSTLKRSTGEGGSKVIQS
jgi:hypothetical protein